MAYDTYLEDRISNLLKSKNIEFENKKMFGGLCFMIDDKMCIGIVENKMMIRVDPMIQDECLSQEGCVIMDFTKRPMKGYLYILPEAMDNDENLSFWAQKAIDFNPSAKSSKKKKKS